MTTMIVHFDVQLHYCSLERQEKLGKKQVANFGFTYITDVSTKYTRSNTFTFGKNLYALRFHQGSQN